jgi:hypothetical protein
MSLVSKKDIINEFMRILISDNPDEVSNREIIMKEAGTFYDDINLIFGEDITFEIFFEQILTHPNFKKYFPYKCFISENLKRKYTQILIPNDGNCLFHCLSKTLFIGLDHKEIRKIICDNLKDTIDFLNHHNLLNYISSNVNDTKDYDGYIKKMRVDETHATPLEIFTAEKICGKNIQFFDMNGKNLDKAFKEKLKKVYKLPAYEENWILYLCAKENEKDKEPVHYELLIPNKKYQQFKDAQLASELYKTEQLHKIEIDRQIELDKQREETDRVFASKVDIEQKKEVEMEKIRKAELDKEIEKTDRELALELHKMNLNLKSDQELSDRELAKKLSTQQGGNIKNFKYKYLKYKMKYLKLLKNQSILIS